MQVQSIEIIDVLTVMIKEAEVDLNSLGEILEEDSDECLFNEYDRLEGNLFYLDNLLKEATNNPTVELSNYAYSYISERF